MSFHESPLKKTASHKDPVNHPFPGWSRPADYQYLRDQLDLAHERLRMFEQAFGLERDLTPSLRFGLTAKLTRVFNILMARPVVSKSALSAIYGSTSADSCADSRYIGRQVSRLRRRLQPHGISISRLFGEGWTIPEESKTKARAMLRDGPP